MGLFNWFNKNRPQTQTEDTDNSGNGQKEIPKDLFIEERDPEEQAPKYSADGGSKGIEAIYAFLQADYETMGYNDALTNSDDNYKAEKLRKIKADLQILIMQVHAQYKDNLMEIELQIKRMKDAGLNNIMEELQTKKQQINERLEIIKRIQNDSENMNGLCESITSSYQRGFNRGLAAITKSKFL